MVKKTQDIKKTLAEYFVVLDTDPTIIKDYADYIEKYHKMKDNNKNLEMQKNEIENMQGQLKRLEGSVNATHSTDLEYIKNQYAKLQL